MTNAAALLQTSLAGLPLVRRGKVRDVYAVDDDLQVELAHAVDDGLPCLLVRPHAERRVFLGQAGQSCPQLLPLSSLHNRFLWTWISVDGFSSLLDHTVRPFSLQDVDDHVVRDAKEPGGKVPALVPAETGERFQEDIAGGILRRFAATEAEETVPVDAVKVTFVEASECVGICPSACSC